MAQANFLQSVLTTQGLNSGDIIQQINVKKLIDELQAMPEEFINANGNIEVRINVRDFPSREGGLTHFRPLVKPAKLDSHKSAIEVK